MLFLLPIITCLIGFILGAFAWAKAFPCKDCEKCQTCEPCEPCEDITCPDSQGKCPDPEPCSVEDCSTVQAPYKLHERTDRPGHDLYEIKGASIDELKGVCSALKQCAGFNSKGYLKKVIGDGSKLKDSHLHLYEKVQSQ